jgi:hypothetical protein
MGKRGVKITLGQAILQGDRIAMFHCEAWRPTGAPCGHTGEARLIELIDSWGPHTRLDELPVRCTACGSQQVDVRARPFKRAGGHAVGQFIESDGLPYGDSGNGG